MIRIHKYNEKNRFLLKTILPVRRSEFIQILIMYLSRNKYLSISGTK